MANLGTHLGAELSQHFTIHTPLISLSKPKSSSRAYTCLGLDYSLTHSCYDPTPAGLACGRCD